MSCKNDYKELFEEIQNLVTWNSKKSRARTENFGRTCNFLAKYIFETLLRQTI